MAGADSWQKEQLSRALVHALASQAKCTVGDWNVDKDGVDVTLRRGPVMVDLQLKCTSSPRMSDAYVAQSLDAATFNKLRDANRSAPGYLVVVVASRKVSQWIVHHPDHVLLACHAYWALLQDRQDAPTGKTKTVHVPRQQVLDAAALKRMFGYAQRRIRGAA